MKKILLTILSLMIFTGVFMPTTAKAERIWYKIEGDIIYVYDDFRDKYPWIDWQDWATGGGTNGLGWGGYIPGVIISGGSGEGLVDRVVEDARDFGVTVNPSDVKITTRDGNSLATVTFDSLSEVTEDQLAKGVDVGFVYTAYKGKEPMNNRLYKINLSGSLDNLQFNFVDSNGVNSSRQQAIYGLKGYGVRLTVDQRDIYILMIDGVIVGRFRV